MKISKLAIQNFRIISNAVLDLSSTPFVCIRGKKYAGKSSIGQAVSMILTDTTQALDGQGRGYVSKIRRGESKSVLSGQIQGKHLIERTVTLNTNTSGRTSKSTCIDDPDWHPLPFENFLSRYRDALIVATNTDYLLTLGEKEQKNLLAKLVLPERHDFPKEKTEAVDKYIGQGVVNFNGEPFAVIALAYDKLYKERAVVNRQVKEFEIPEPMLNIPADLETLQKQLGDAKKTRTDMLAEKDRAVSKANEIEVKRAGLQANLESLRADVTRGEARLTALAASILNAEQLKGLTETAAKADELKRLREQHAAYRESIGRVTEQKTRLNAIADEGTTCPTCDQSIDAARLSQLATELDKEIEVADRELQTLDTKIEAIGDVGSALAAIQKHKDAEKEKETLTASLQETVKVGKAKRAELDALGEKVDAAATFTQPLALLNADIDALTEALRPVIAAEERKKDIAVKTEQLAKLQAKAKAVDELVEYFGKDGIKATLIADHIGKFENMVLDVMSICGYKCSLTLEPFDFQVETARGYIGPVKELSGAEKHLFCATFQLAVSIAAGINMVVIDEIQELGEELLRLFYGKVYGLIQSGDLEQAIMIGYSTDKALPNPQAPGSAYYLVEDGQVSLLGRRTA